MVSGEVAGELTADFTVDCSFLECRFDRSPDVIVAWVWDFGDGHTSTEQNPTHVYEVAEPTTFTVSLAIANTDIATGGTSRAITVVPAPGGYTVEP